MLLNFFLDLLMLVLQWSLIIGLFYIFIKVFYYITSALPHDHDNGGSHDNQGANRRF